MRFYIKIKVKLMQKKQSVVLHLFELNIDINALKYNQA